jgi:hypothetical protein
MLAVIVGAWAAGAAAELQQPQLAAISMGVIL